MAAFISDTDAICKNLLSKIRNGDPDGLRLAANYLCLGGESSNIPKAICDSLNSLFDKYKTSEFSQIGFEMFFDGLCENLMEIFVYSDVETESITTLGEHFKIVDSMLGGSPEFVYPTPTHDSEAKYYAHLFVKILNEKNATVFPECYSDDDIAKHCKDYLISENMDKAKLCVMRISTKDDLDKHSATLLMLVKQIMLLHSPREYKLVLYTIFKETQILSKIDKPVHTVIVDFLKGKRPVLVETGSAEERFWKLVSDFESKIETFDETFYIESLQLCVEFARYGFLTLTDGVLKTLNEKFVESKLPVKKALKYLVCAGHSYVSLKKRLSKTKNDANLEQNAQNLDNHCGFVSREINGPVDFGPINY